MRKTLLACALLLVVASPAHAIIRGCTSSMVTLGICRATTDAAVCTPVSTIDPDNGGPRLAPSVIALDAIAALYGWSASMTCTQEMVAVGICSSGQLNTSVAVTKTQFAEMVHRRWFIEQIRAYRGLQERATADAAVTAEPAPDIGN